MRKINKLSVGKVEENLRNIFERYSLSHILTAADVKEKVLGDDDPDPMSANLQFQKWWMAYFPQIKDLDEFNEVLKVFVDAWNYFPHRSLGGKSPMQMIIQAQNDPNLKNIIGTPNSGMKFSSDMEDEDFFDDCSICQELKKQKVAKTLKKG